MELIDQLEQKIDSLLASNEALRQENTQLLDALQHDMETYQAETARLTQELERERAARLAVAARIDGLLRKLEAGAGDAADHAQP
ncbi:cell division protein ZapB [Megalodesulfovibrio gigas]|uniref:cell division protein ZapB n=1 Tax=Megalodesulfovibrio gigas TaxID=879 RepID=UPI0004071617|nr:cell division protein ZapB [Megalodesulfovibrio gigas]